MTEEQLLIVAKTSMAGMKAAVAALPEDDRLLLTCIGTSLDNIIKAGGSHAKIAISLKAAEIVFEQHETNVKEGGA